MMFKNLIKKIGKPFLINKNDHGFYMEINGVVFNYNNNYIYNTKSELYKKFSEYLTSVKYIPFEINNPLIGINTAYGNKTFDVFSIMLINDEFFKNSLQQLNDKNIIEPIKKELEKYEELYSYNNMKNWSLYNIPENTIDKLVKRREYAKNYISKVKNKLNNNLSIDEIVQIITPNMRAFIPNTLKDAMIYNFINNVIEDKDGEIYGIIIKEK